MKLRLARALAAGMAATAAMTLVMLMAPAMGLPAMNMGSMLGAFMGGNSALGWMAHFMVGLLLAVIYAALFSTRLPGPSPLRGALFGLGPWLMAQLVLMPMMDMGLFSGSVTSAAGSLLGHVVYGAVLGTVYGRGSEQAPLAHPVHA